MKTEKNILIAFLLNIFFSLFEFIGGFLTGSIAILSDSLHDFGDALSIGISYFLETKSKNQANDKYTYGYVKYSVLGSVITTIILILGSVFVMYESVKRIINPTVIHYNGMIIIAVFGVVVNFIAAYKTKDGGSLNQKAVNLHMLEDVFGWIVVLIGSVLMKFTNISIIDPILSLCVAVFIFVAALKNMNSALDIFLEKTPHDIDINDLRKHLLNIKGVKDVHHIHVRTIDGYNNFVTLHVVADKYNKKIKNDVREELKEHGINHSTIELEMTDEYCDSEICNMDNDGVKSHHHH